LDQHALDDGIQRKDTGIEKGTHNQVIGVTLNNDHERETRVKELCLLVGGIWKVLTIY
jgi:hypothetical protein